MCDSVESHDDRVALLRDKASHTVHELEDMTDYAMPVPVHQLATPEDYLSVLAGHPTVSSAGEQPPTSSNADRTATHDPVRHLTSRG